MFHQRVQNATLALGPLSHSGRGNGDATTDHVTRQVDCQNGQECLLIGDLCLAGSRHRYLWKSVVLTLQLNYYCWICIANTTTRLMRLQLVG